MVLGHHRLSVQYLPTRVSRYKCLQIIYSTKIPLSNPMLKDRSIQFIYEKPLDVLMDLPTVPIWWRWRELLGPSWPSPFASAKGSALSAHPALRVNRAWFTSFTLKNSISSSSNKFWRHQKCLQNLVEVAGIEPASARAPQSGATFLVCALV